MDDFGELRQHIQWRCDEVRNFVTANQLIENAVRRWKNARYSFNRLKREYPLNKKFSFDSTWRKDLMEVCDRNEADMLILTTLHCLKKLNLTESQGKALFILLGNAE